MTPMPPQVARLRVAALVERGVHLQEVRETDVDFLAASAEALNNGWVLALVDREGWTTILHFDKTNKESVR